jgi:hypothetical protein
MDGGEMPDGAAAGRALLAGQTARGWLAALTES